MMTPQFRTLVVVACALAALVSAWAQADSPVQQPASAPTSAPAMDQHTLVLLVLRDDAPKLNADESAELQKKHLAHIASMSKTGKVLAAGPFSNRDDEHFRGILVFACGIEEARALCEQDPAVRAGRLKVVCQTWNVARDAVVFPKAIR